MRWGWACPPKTPPTSSTYVCARGRSAFGGGINMFVEGGNHITFRSPTHTGSCMKVIQTSAAFPLLGSFPPKRPWWTAVWLPSLDSTLILHRLETSSSICNLLTRAAVTLSFWRGFWILFYLYLHEFSGLAQPCNGRQRSALKSVLQTKVISIPLEKGYGRKWGWQCCFLNLALAIWQSVNLSLMLLCVNMHTLATFSLIWTFLTKAAILFCIRCYTGSSTWSSTDPYQPQVFNSGNWIFNRCAVNA